MLTGTWAHPDLGRRIAWPRSHGAVASQAGKMARSLGMVDESWRDRSAGPRWPLEVVPCLTETDRHDPETGIFGRLLGVYSTFDMCLRLGSPIGAQFPSQPDISIAGNNRTFLLRFDTRHTTVPICFSRSDLPKELCRPNAATGEPNCGTQWDFLSVFPAFVHWCTRAL